MRRRRAIGWMVLVLTATTPGPAIARPTPQQEAEDLAARAKAEFKAGQFEQAAKDFMAAYGRTKKAPLVFNAARSYEEAGKTGDAAALFRLYLSISDDADGMRDAQARLERLESAGRAKAGSVPAPVPARGSGSGAGSGAGSGSGSAPVPAPVTAPVPAPATAPGTVPGQDTGPGTGSG